MSTANLLLSLVLGLGLLGGIGLGIKAWYERKLLRATASSTDATATAVIVAAARELVDPLRQELAKERAEHAEEIQVERTNLAKVRGELASALDECHTLRGQLARVRTELEAVMNELTLLQNSNVKYRIRIAELEEGTA